MTSQELFAELEQEAIEEREMGGNDLPGQDDEMGEREVTEEQTDI